MNPHAYSVFMTGLDLGVLPCEVYTDDQRGDLYATLWRPPRPSPMGQLPEAFGALLWCVGSCLGVDPLAEVGDENSLDLLPRRELRKRLLEEVVWFASPEALIEALGGDRWGMGLYGRLMAYRSFRSAAAQRWGLPSPRRDLGVDDRTFALVEYDPYEGSADVYALTPALAVYCWYLPLSSRIAFARVQLKDFHRKCFYSDYVEGYREDHDATLALLESHCREVVEAAAETFGEGAEYPPRASAETLDCLIVGRDLARRRGRLVLVEREHDSTTEHYPYKSKGMPEGEKMRPDLKRPQEKNGVERALSISTVAPLAIKGGQEKNDPLCPRCRGPLGDTPEVRAPVAKSNTSAPIAYCSRRCLEEVEAELKTLTPAFWGNTKKG